MVKQRWVFGMKPRDKNQGPIFYVVPHRSADVLLPIITYHVQQNSIVCSDEWRAYRGLALRGYVHGTVNHSTHFVNPQTGLSSIIAFFILYYL